MIDKKALDDALTLLIDKKMTLSKMEYSDEAYDDLEEELHSLEDKFLENFGDFLEDAFHEVHDEYCPDNEVLLPIAYLPSHPKKTDNGFEVSYDDGVFVEVDDYDSTQTRLVLLPHPTRIILNVDKNQQEVVWNIESK
ncbi:MAG: hypothetical protein R3345_02545 [Fulvivirga sp.]|nr:hypothetical protein [Fulvivirga sp.]